MAFLDPRSSEALSEALLFSSSSEGGETGSVAASSPANTPGIAMMAMAARIVKSFICFALLSFRFVRFDFFEQNIMAEALASIVVLLEILAERD